MNLPPPPADAKVKDSLVLVDHPQGLAALLAALDGLDRVGIDTEFHAERRYRPELLLVQIAIPGGQVWLVDPTRVDIRPLSEALGRLEWVAHGAALDLQLLREVAGAAPRQLVDVQVAAAMTGWHWPIRLGELARDLLGLDLDKSASLSDWSRRPLQPHQQTYAGEDARIVLELARRLRARADDRRWAWVLDAGRQLVREAAEEPDPNENWLRLGMAWTLDEPTCRVLQALYRWREERAREKGVPPHYTLTDAFALDLARRQPTSLAELLENRRLPSGLVQRHGAEIVEVVRRAVQSDEPVPRPPSRAERQLAQALQAWAVALEDACGVAPELLLPRSLADRVAREGAEALSGWRRDAAASALEDFLKGRTRLSVKGATPVISPS